MKYEAKSPDEYIEQLPPERRPVMQKLRETILANLPEGFEEAISYGMIGYSVPKRLYPAGYHANPSEPLPFMAIASQKNHIALYHMALQMFPEIQDWFVKSYAGQVKTKLDMGKGCIRFRNASHIPYELIAELTGKISVDDYIQRYEALLRDGKC